MSGDLNFEKFYYDNPDNRRSYFIIRFSSMTDESVSRELKHYLKYFMITECLIFI